MQDDPDYERVSKLQLESDIKEVEAFLASRLFKKYQIMVKEKKTETENSILHSAPGNLDQMIEKAQLFGERNNLEFFQTLFEEHRTGLENLLSKLDS